MASERLQDGTLLGGRYEIQAAVGRGGMGAVYRARDSRLDCAVAVKELLDRYDTDEERAESIRHFEREARLLAQLSHPHLPRVYDYFVEDGRCYLVMEFVEGETLEDRLQRESRIPLLAALDWAAQLADALVYLHSRNPPIVFRDLKPANIIAAQDGGVKLIDFGIARRFQQGAAKDTLLYGSPGYSPPEQYGRAQTDPRSDIYAFGATLHHMVTGRDPAPQPFKFPSIRKIDPALPPALEELIQRCVEMDEHRRIQTASEVRQSVAAIRDEARLRAERFSPKAGPGVTRKPSVMALLSVLTLALGVIVVGALWIRQPRRDAAPVQPRARTDSGASAPVDAPLPASPAGKLRIESIPPGATVFLDDVEIGQTPTDVNDVLPGSHNLRFVPPEGSATAPTSRKVEVRAGETVVVEAELPQAAAGSPGPAGRPARVQLLGAQVTPLSAPNPRNLAPGLYYTFGFRIAGGAGRSGTAAVFFYQADGTTALPAPPGADAYRAPNGQLHSSSSLEVSSDPADFQNFTLFVPEAVFPVPYRQATWRFIVHLEGQQVFQSEPSPVLGSG